MFTKHEFNHLPVDIPKRKIEDNLFPYVKLQISIIKQTSSIKNIF